METGRVLECAVPLGAGAVASLYVDQRAHLYELLIYTPGQTVKKQGVGAVTLAGPDQLMRLLRALEEMKAVMPPELVSEARARMDETVPCLRFMETVSRIA